MTTEQNISTAPLLRNEYTISDDKETDANVTQTLGLFYDNKDAKHKKGFIKMNTGNLTIGNFNLNVSGLLLASGISLGVGQILNSYDFDSKTFRKHSDMIKVNSRAVYLPTAASFGIGAIVGFGINSMISPYPSKQAESLAKYDFISENHFDYIINPRFELTKERSFLKKSSYIKLTAKGMNIITNK